MLVAIPNPTGCGDVAVGCCPGNTVKGNLMATIQSVSGCGCAAGLTVPLTWSGKYDMTGGSIWSSQVVDFGSCLNLNPPPPTNTQISLTLLCVAGGPFELAWNVFACSGSGTKGAPDSISGCPGGGFNLVYDNILINGCCGHAIPPFDTIRVTITDA
jgi:hypothetical protein